MTKPTGRPRGRPKTKEYVTLMARVPQDLADRVQRYAGLHQQSISVVLRDGLELLLEEERYRPFISDVQTVAENTSDIKAASAPFVSDEKVDASSIASDMKEGRSYIASDMKEGISSLMPDSTTAPSSMASDKNGEANHGPVQPLQPPEPEPADRDSLEWRRWAVLEQVRAAQAPTKPGDIARQIGSTSALVRHDLEYWRQQGRVQRDAQGGYVCSSGVLARVSDTLAHDRRPSVGPPVRQTPTAPGQTSGQTAQSSPRADGRQHRGAAKKSVRQERGKK